MFEKFELRQDLYVGFDPGEYGHKEITTKEKILKLIFQELQNTGLSSTLESSYYNHNNIAFAAYPKEIYYRKWFMQRTITEEYIEFSLIFPDGEPKIRVVSRQIDNKIITSVVCGAISFELSPEEKSNLYKAVITWMNLIRVGLERGVEEKIDQRLKANE